MCFVISYPWRFCGLIPFADSRGRLSATKCPVVSSRRQGEEAVIDRLPPGGSWREAPEGECVAKRFVQAKRREGSFRHAIACHLPLGGRLVVSVSFLAAVAVLRIDFFCYPDGPLPNASLPFIPLRTPRGYRPRQSGATHRGHGHRTVPPR